MNRQKFAILVLLSCLVMATSYAYADANDSSRVPQEGGVSAYLPVMFQRWPAPMLNSIDNSDGDGNYTVSWQGSALADMYALEESTTPDFATTTVLYEGSALTQSVTERAAGTYYYRVQARNSNNQSEWSEAQAATVNVLYFDDYTNDISGWEITNDTITRWRYINGRYEGAVKQPGFITLVRAPMMGDTYTLEADVYPINGFAQGGNGLVFGLSEDWSQYYLFQISGADSGYYSVFKRTPSGWVILREWTPHYVSNNLNVLKVARQGATAHLYINNKYVTTIEDGDFVGPRRVGVAVSAFSFASSWGIAQFDDFTLRVFGSGTQFSLMEQGTEDMMSEPMQTFMAPPTP